MKKFELSRVNLYTILRDLVQNAWIIVLALITGFVGSFCYYSYIHKHQYVSNMIVSINLGGYTTNATALSLARTVIIAETLDDVFQSQAVCEVVRKDLGEEITGTIEASQLGDTNLVSISVSDTSPEKAYKTLVSVYNNYEKVTDYVFSNVIIRTVVNPSMPTSPAGIMTATLLGIIIGGLAAAAVAFLIIVISYMRDTVKNIADVEGELNVKLFGVVHRVKSFNKKLPQSRRRLIITNPLVGFNFVNSFRKMAIKIESLRRTKGINTYMITSVTENEGKTSMSVNIAMALAQNGHKVLLLDCDFRKPAIYHFFDNIVRPEDSDFHQYIDKGGDITHYIKHDSESGLYIADNIEFCDNSSEKFASTRFTETIKALKKQFDYIIVDTSPCGITVDPEIIADVVDAALIVVRQDVVAVTDINDHIDNLNKCYIAGCVFSDFAQLKSNKQAMFESNDAYYTRLNSQEGR